MMDASKTRVAVDPNDLASVRRAETDAMGKCRVVLACHDGTSLYELIRAGRVIDPDTGEPAKTWDDLAYEVRNRTERAGEPMRLVRETMITWAERYGLAEPREPRKPREAAPAQG